jgi:cytochrome c oxidase cbb3-type subunit III
VVLAAATVWAHRLPHEFPQGETPQSTEARKTFETVCASCHGLDGRGGERGPDLVSRVEVAAKSDAELKEILEKGKTAAGMPSFASYGTERLGSLVGYMRTLQGRGKAARLPGNPAQGKSLFFGKAKCGECHMVAGQGGFFGQDLTRYGSKRGVDDIRAAIVSPDKDLDPRRGLVTVALRNASRLTGLARNEDNFSLQLQTADGTFHLLNKVDIEKLNYEGRSGMPANYGSILSASELNDLISFLLRSAGTQTDQAKGPDDDFEE